MPIYNPDEASKQAWATLVEKQNKGLKPEEFTWFTPEDIPMKVLYTADDTSELPYTDTMPGISPYIRGPQATMYAGRRWTIRQDNPDIVVLFGIKQCFIQLKNGFWTKGVANLGSVEGDTCHTVSSGIGYVFKCFFRDPYTHKYSFWMSS
mgnify:CR=1 FL=1